MFDKVKTFLYKNNYLNNCLIIFYLDFANSCLFFINKNIYIILLWLLTYRLTNVIK